MARPRRESRIAHAYKAQCAHTHNVASKREPGRVVQVRCTRTACTLPRGERK